MAKQRSRYLCISFPPPRHPALATLGPAPRAPLARSYAIISSVVHLAMPRALLGR